MTTPTPSPRRAAPTGLFYGRVASTTPRRAVVETTPEPRSVGDPRHLAMNAHGTRKTNPDN